ETSDAEDASAAETVVANSDSDADSDSDLSADADASSEPDDELSALLASLNEPAAAAEDTPSTEPEMDPDLAALLKELG
ncbi:MAG: hypothetical protein H7Z19_20800, partial [Chitinophagaceae bacterium]|nr:hypothetical protein [Rubrivivax sp.]